MNLNLDSIAKDISELEAMPYDDTYYEACINVAEDLYDLDYETAIKVADIIQDKYLTYPYWAYWCCYTGSIPV